MGVRYGGRAKKLVRWAEPVQSGCDKRECGERNGEGGRRVVSRLKEENNMIRRCGDRSSDNAGNRAGRRNGGKGPWLDESRRWTF